MPIGIRLPPATDQAFRILGIRGEIDRIAAECTVDDVAEIDRRVDEFKKAAESAYRRLAHEHHPDHGGDSERMKELNAAIGIVRKFSMKHAPVRRSRRMARDIQSAYSQAILDHLQRNSFFGRSINLDVDHESTVSGDGEEYTFMRFSWREDW
jgi:hypothetical protein